MSKVVITPTPTYKRDEWVRDFNLVEFLNDPKLLCQFGNINATPQHPNYLLLEDQKGWLNADVRNWRKSVRAGRISLIPKNQREIECKVNGVSRKFYTLTMSYPDGEGGVKQCSDINAMMLFGWIVPGLTYFFPCKTNRDRVLEWMCK